MSLHSATHERQFAMVFVPSTSLVEGHAPGVRRLLPSPAMTIGRWRIQGVLVGGAGRSLQTVLRNVLTEFEVDLVNASAPRPDVVFAIIGPRDHSRVLAAAQRAARHRAPIIAIIPIAYERSPRRALLGGRAVLLGAEPPAAVSGLGTSRFSAKTHPERP